MKKDSLGKEALKFAFKVIEHEFDHLTSEKRKLQDENYKLRQGLVLQIKTTVVSIDRNVRSE